jgi:DNA-binding GntR family transcriptional regulator
LEVIILAPEIDRNSPTPIFEQITNWMREKILSGEWKNDHKLPAETDLADELNVSRGTVRKAIESLLSQRLLVRIHGKGTFVKNQLLLEQKPNWRLAGFSRDLISRGIPYSTEVLSSEITHPTLDVRGLLKLKPDDLIFHMYRLRKIEEQPVLLIENHLVYSACEGVEKVDFTKKQLYLTLEDEFGIKFDWSRRTYKAVVASDRINKYLLLPKKSPLMYLEELYHNTKNIPIEYTRAWFDASVFHIKAIIRREDEKQEQPGIYH